MRLLLIIVGAFAAIVCIASPALAQSDHQRKHLRTSTYQSNPPALAAPHTQYLRDPRTWVGDPAGRPYVYVPSMALGGN
jgi:hypothetical protein